MTVALDEADQLRLAEIERGLEQDSRLSRSLRGAPGQARRRAAATVLGAVAVLLTGFGWLSVEGGTPVPLLLAALPAAAALGALSWLRTAPARLRPADPGPELPRDAPPPWWLS